MPLATLDELGKLWSDTVLNKFKEGVIDYTKNLNAGPDYTKDPDEGLIGPGSRIDVEKWKDERTNS